MKPLTLFSIFLLLFPVLHAQEGTVTGIAWNGSTWLIAGYWSNASHLIEYDGKTFYELKGFKKFQLSSIRQIIWNDDNNYWVITGHRGDDAVLIKYNGEKLEEIACVHSYCTGDLVWDGKDYLMVTCGSAMIGATGYVKLFENGSIAKYVPFYWGYGRIFQSDGRILTSNGTVLFVYNGKIFEEFSELKLGIRDMGFNGSNWLICGFNELVAFNGTYYRPIIIEECDKIEWGDGYWLIAEDGRLVKYDGRVLSQVGDIPEFMSITAIKWNGNYWLIGGRGHTGLPKLVKYDGHSFEDLTEKMLNAGSLEQTTNMKNRKPEKIPTEEKRKAICGPSFILLLSATMLFLRRC